jgi:hypothetical protein
LLITWRRASPAELARAVQLGGEHRHHLVAVDDLAALVDEDGAVGVAVERDPDVRAVRADRGLRAPGMERAAAAVDVLGRRVDAERDHLGAELLEHLGRDAVRGAVAAVDHDREPSSVRWRGNVFFTKTL